MKKTIYTFLVSACLTVTAHAQPGTLDNTFNLNGMQTTPIGTGEDIGYSVAIDNNTGSNSGKILVAGSSNNGSNKDFALTRYNNDGSPDASFGTIITPIGTGDEEARSVAIYSNITSNTDKIILAGYSKNGSNFNFALARYNSNGILDATFGTNGIVTTDFGGLDIIYSIAIQSDDKIVVAGITSVGANHKFAIARYLSNGNLDLTFGVAQNGKIITSIGTSLDEATAVAIDYNPGTNFNRIVVTGYSWNGSNWDFALACYNINGTPDNTFGPLNNGQVTTSFNIFDDRPFSVAIDHNLGVNNDKILVSGYSNNGNDYDVAIARYNINGSLDNSFGAGGLVTTDFSGNDIGYSVHLQSDDKIILAGQSDVTSPFNSFILARYGSNGSLDNSFGTNGKVTTTVGVSSDGYSSTIQPDGKIVVAGDSWNGSNYDFAVARYNVALPCTNPSTPTISSSSLTNCGTQSTTLSIATGTLNDAVNWQWYSGSCGGTSLGAGASINVSPTVTTTYFARGEGGCVTPGACTSVTITVNNAPTITPTVTNPTTCGGTDGTVTLGVTGTGPFTYEWSGNFCVIHSDCSFFGAGSFCQFGVCHGINQNLTNMPAGTYTVIVTGQGGCNTTTSVTLTQPTGPTSVISGSQTICSGYTATNITIALTGTPPWDITVAGDTNPIVFTGVTTNPYTFNTSPSSNTTYTISSLIDANCTATAPDMTGSAVVTVTGRPHSVISGSQTICSGYTAMNITIALTGTPPWDITVAGDTNPIVFTGVTTNPYTFNTSPSSNTTYTISSLIDANCTATAPDMTGSAMISVTSRPHSVISGSQTICSGNTTSNISVALTGTPPWDFIISDGSTPTNYTGITTNPFVFTASPGSNTTYTVSSLNDANCTAFPSDNTGSAVITVNSNITVTATSATVCAGQSATLTASGGTTYLWSTNETSSSINVTIAGTYTVTGTTNGCSGTATGTVILLPLPVINTVANQSICVNTNTAPIVFSGGATGTVYNWVNSNTSIGLTASGSGDISSFTGLNTGIATETATITVTPTLNGCSGASISFTIKVKVPPGAPVVLGPADLCQVSTAGYKASSTGSGPITYLWTVPTQVYPNGGVTGMSIFLGQNTDSITTHITSGNLPPTMTCTATNSCGTSTTTIFSISKKPGTPGDITGPNLCGTNNTATYSVPQQGAYRYNWVVSAGLSIDNSTPATAFTCGSGSGNTVTHYYRGNSISVTKSTGFIVGTIKVWAVNCCGYETDSFKIITVYGTVPLTPSAINGVTVNCSNLTRTYNTPVVGGATGYQWTLTNVVPAGSAVLSPGTGTTVTVTYLPSFTSGKLNVRSNNPCGISTGTRTITITKMAGCFNLSPIVIDNNIDETNPTLFNVYPNPSSGTFIVENGQWSIENGQLTIEVYDVIGNKVLQSAIRNPKSEISLESYRNGLYFIRVTDKNANTIYSQKIIKE